MWILQVMWGIVNIMKDIKELIKYPGFAKLDIRAGTIICGEKIEGSKKLIRMDVDFGEVGIKQIIAGLAEWYKPEDLIGLQTVFVVNLEPIELMGYESQGMILGLGLDDSQKPVLLIPQAEVENGEGLR